MSVPDSTTPAARAALPRRLGVAFDDLSPGAKIREVALQLFAQRGIRATSIRMVAAAAGVSPGAVVHHYPSKHALERAVHNDVVQRIVDAVHGIDSSEDIAEALEGRHRAYDAVLRDQPYVADYIRRILMDDNPESVEFFERSLDGIRTEMRERVDTGIAREFEDPDLGLALYWLIVNARFILRPYLEGVLGLDLDNPSDLKRLHRAEIDLLTHAVFIPARSTKTARRSTKA